MNIIRTQLFRAILMVTLISSWNYLTLGKESPPSADIVRHLVWNDFIARNWTEKLPAGYAFNCFIAYSHTMMRRAFVLQLGPETKTAEGPFEGLVEEVDSCTEHYRGAVEVSGGSVSTLQWLPLTRP